MKSYTRKSRQDFEGAEQAAKDQSNNLWQGTRAILEDRTSSTNKMKILTIVAVVILVVATIVSHVTKTPEIVYVIIAISGIMLGLWVRHDMKSLEHINSITRAANDLQSTIVHSHIPLKPIDFKIY